jgi:NADH dehydrogenase FAD-containing subunit
VAVKPFEPFVKRLNQKELSRVAIAGGGAAGMEIAMALRHRGAAVTVFSDKPSMPPALAWRAARAARRMGVDLREARPLSSIEPGPVVISGAAQQAFDLVLLATGAAPLAWPRAAGLTCDERGYVLVDTMLRSVSHPEVFAVGDCASLRDASHPKSGVYSVRHGEALGLNLRNLIEGRALQEFEPQPRSLTLLSCGRKYAIAQRGGWSAEGAWAWHWKDWIDRRWVRSSRV